MYSEFEPKPAPPLRGHELFSGTDIPVADFFTWGFSDLRLNVIRGVLAEFLVTRALGETGDSVRYAWDNYDVLAPGGLRLEVKSSSYLQSWTQRRLSTPSFSGLRRRTWSSSSGYSPEAKVKADAFVFALHTSESHDDYDPLDLSQWRFWGASAAAIWDDGAQSLGLGSVQRLCGESVDWWHLRDLVERLRALSKGDR